MGTNNNTGRLFDRVSDRLMPLAGWHDVRLTDDVLLARIAMVKYISIILMFMEDVMD